jgi:exodeoxyribonuclease V alpha subunit
MNATPASLRKSGHLRRVDAALGDWVARAFSDAAPDVALAAALAARAVADGHSALALDEVQAWLAGLEGDGKPVTLPDVATWCEALRYASAVSAGDDASAAPVPLVLDAQRRVYLQRYFQYESELARALVARIGDGGHVLHASHADLDVEGIDPEQRRAIDIALAQRFTLVTGGPGTGKTHAVARILAALASQPRDEKLRIALAAPTGKAAARLKESVQAQAAAMRLPESVATAMPADANTLHRLLGLSLWSARPRHRRDALLPFDVVVVDEVSMVDLPLMAKLVDAVRPDARLILLGDPDQLSAVEAGNVLGALVEAAHAGPLRECHVELTQSHRFGPGSGLGALARAIAAQDVDAALTACAHGAGVTLADTASAAHLVEEAAAAYQPVIAASGPAEALRAVRGFRVLTALRHGPSGCIALDTAIAARLQRGLGLRADERWWRGRLVLVTANRPDLGLFNGDTGVAWPDADGVMKAWFEGADDMLRALPVAALPPHEGAFALTVHKAQGSEFERVALVTGPASAVLTRELLYTGVTRARSGITLYTTPDTLRAGIARRTLSMTGLADRLREAAAAPFSEIAESLPGST